MEVQELIKNIEKTTNKSNLYSKLKNFRTTVEERLDIGGIEDFSWSNHENHTDHSDYQNHYEKDKIKSKLFKKIIAKGALLVSSDESLTNHYDHDNHTNWTDK